MPCDDEDREYMKQLIKLLDSMNCLYNDDEKIIENISFAIIPSMIIVTKKQTTAETVIPAKPCTPVMEIWMWRSQGIVTVITNHS